jgi:hypothetical protein
MKGAAIFLLITGTGACASTPWDAGLPRAAKQKIAGGVAELRVTSFDGRDLTARVLVGATVDPLVLDRQMTPWSNVELNKIRACDTKEPLKHSRWEYFFLPAPGEDVVTVPRGYWWGGNVFFMLFEGRKKSKPDCFEAELVVLDTNGRVAATQTVRVVNTEKPEDTKP